jgi:hypothetical protein
MPSPCEEEAMSLTAGRDPRDPLEEMIEELAFPADCFEEVDKEAVLDRRDLQRVAERSLEIRGRPPRVCPHPFGSAHRRSRAARWLGRGT